MFISCFNPELLISKNEISLLFVIQVIVRKRMNDDNKLITMKGNFVHVGDSECTLKFLRNWKSHHVAIVVRALQCVPTARTSSFFLEEKKKKGSPTSNQKCPRVSALPSSQPLLRLLRGEVPCFLE